MREPRNSLISGAKCILSGRNQGAALIIDCTAMLSQECGKQRVAGELRIDAIYDEHVIGGFEGDADRWPGGSSGLARTVEALLYSVCHPVDVHRVRKGVV